MPGAILNNFEVAAAAGEWVGLLQSPGEMSKHMEILNSPDPDSSGTPNSILGHMLLLLLLNKLQATLHR